MNQREAVERFHLTFLRHFSAVVSPGTVSLKGGVNLRLYHNSSRLSEDMDFDARVVAVDTLKKNVKKVLGSKPLLTELAAVGITLSEIKPSKQTQTTQRWKFHVLFDVNDVPSRLEFSRRQEEPFVGCVIGVPATALLALHQVQPFVFPHYTTTASYRQKVIALALRTQVQSRDVFDLHHLAAFADAGKSLSREMTEKAIGQLRAITFEDFMGQVIPFLPVDLAAYYGTEALWKTISDTVHANLVTALPEEDT